MRNISLVLLLSSLIAACGPGLDSSDPYAPAEVNGTWEGESKIYDYPQRDSSGNAVPFDPSKSKPFMTRHAKIVVVQDGDSAEVRGLCADGTGGGTMSVGRDAARWTGEAVCPSGERIQRVQFVPTGSNRGTTSYGTLLNPDGTHREYINITTLNKT